jgi:hypothetical protein
MQAPGVVDRPVIAPKGRDGEDRPAPLGGPPTAPVGPEVPHSQRLPAADR